METKQYVTKQQIDYLRNYSGHHKIHREKWEQRHSDPNPVQCSKGSS